MGSLDSIHPSNTFRFEPVGMLFKRYDALIKGIIQKTTSPANNPSD
jgi:hypothetical protein